MRHIFLAVVFALAAIARVPDASASDLRESFRAPPPSARPWVYWFWMNGNITREGITADLEAMARVGIGGVLIMSVSNGIPPGRIEFLSPQWRGLFAHAVREAARLGIEIDMNNDDGWTGSGGPWVGVADSMQVLTWSETRVAGPAEFDGALALPPSCLDHYRDIAVFAVPSSGPAMRQLSPKVKSAGARFDGAALIDEKMDTGVNLPKPSLEKPVIIDVEFPQPFTARSLTIVTGPGRQNHGGRLEASDDGRSFRAIRKFSIPGAGINASVLGASFESVTARFFRIVFDREAPRGGGLSLRELDLSPEARINDWPSKSGRTRADGVGSVTSGVAPIPRDRVLDISAAMAESGRLRWKVPEGHWLILRLGHTTTGKTNHPATPGGTGLECDKFSCEAMDHFFDGMMAKLVADAGPLAGKALTFTHIDSWEVGSQNWTPKFPEAFRERRGYDARPYLPIMLGFPVGGPDIAERFLWDMRLTFADLIADNYVGHLRELARRHGMGLSIEAYGNGNFNNLQCAARADMPMSEFWAGRPEGAERGKEPASVAHQLGIPIVGAESFTADPDSDRWTQHPYAIKALGDGAFCSGINRFIFHRYAMQPWMDRLPGMTFGPHGIHYERTNTWFEQSRAWVQYLTRCQSLLQQGTIVADLLYFVGESAPKGLSSRRGLKPPPPDGYDYDGCDAEALLKHATVEDGRIVFPGGVAYRLLVLPPEAIQMTPRLLRKLRELVEAGAIVLGPKPERSPSLENYPTCDQEVRQLAESLWGDTSAPGAKATGRGKIYWGKTVEEILGCHSISPDIGWTSPTGTAHVKWIHRVIGEAHVYFISNPSDNPEVIDAVFRVSGKRPELWDPATGVTEGAPIWTCTSDGRTSVRLRLDPRGSIFVILGEPGSPAYTAIFRNGEPVDGRPVVRAVHITKALYGILDDAGRTRDVTARIGAMVTNGTLSVRAWSNIAGDPAPNVRKTLRVEYTADGEAKVASVQDGETLSISEAFMPPRPDAELRDRGNGARLVAWKPGHYEIRSGPARPITAEVVDLPPPIELAGPWDLSFPPNLGAPVSVRLDKLMSWPEHPDDGVRHFSGTGVYRSTFDVPEKLVLGHRPSQIDLGRVEVMAEVILNGKNLGVLWKQPFLVDVTGALKPGENRLEIRVTNLWSNRLIGDDRRPPYLKWTGPRGGPAEWPDWVMDGSAVPVTGRITFTTWHHYGKDDPLLPSGLIGPVAVRFGSELDLVRKSRASGQ
ncbi:MAG TPA: glycosyl hydrolase [Verrucomicrobiae bacterium]|nr:glycosyl hydrolase [Verrucomicrobiae bacterium]